MIRSLFVLTVLMLCQSCNKIADPIFRSVEDVDVISMTMDNIEVNAVMVFSNPNDFSLNVSNLDITAIIDDKEMGQVTQSKDAVMPAKADFKLPINLKMNLNDAYDGNTMAAIAKGMELMGKRKAMLGFKGVMKVGKGGINISVPIDEITEVAF